MHTKFRGNRPLVPEKKIFEGFYDIRAWRSSCSCDQHHIQQIFISEYLPRKGDKQNLGKNGIVVSEESKF